MSPVKASILSGQGIVEQVKIVAHPTSTWITRFLLAASLVIRDPRLLVKVSKMTTVVDGIRTPTCGCNMVAMATSQMILSLVFQQKSATQESTLNHMPTIFASASNACLCHICPLQLAQQQRHVARAMGMVISRMITASTMLR